MYSELRNNVRCVWYIYDEMTRCVMRSACTYIYDLQRRWWEETERREKRKKKYIPRIKCSLPVKLSIMSVSVQKKLFKLDDKNDRCTAVPRAIAWIRLPFITKRSMLLPFNSNDRESIVSDTTLYRKFDVSDSSKWKTKRLSRSKLSISYARPSIKGM